MRSESTKESRGKICPYDKTRICNENCIAFEKDIQSIKSLPIKDESDHWNEYTWKRAEHIIGDYCNRGDGMFLNWRLIDGSQAEDQA